MTTWSTFTVATDMDASVEATILAIAAARSHILGRPEHYRMG